MIDNTVKRLPVEAVLTILQKYIRDQGVVNCPRCQPPSTDSLNLGDKQSYVDYMFNAR